MKDVCRYVFQSKKENKIIYYPMNIEQIESGILNHMIIPEFEKQYDGCKLVSRDWSTGLCDKKRNNQIFENDKLYDSTNDILGIVKYLDTAVLVVDWEDDIREDLFTAIDNGAYKIGTKYE